MAAAVRGLELAQQAAALKVEAEDAEAEARNLAAQGRDDAARELLERAREVRASVGELAAPYAAARARARSQWHHLEVDVVAYRAVVSQDTDLSVRTLLDRVRTWLEEDPADFG